MHRYIPHTPADRAAMLARCGMASEAELYADVPQELLLGRPYDVGPEMSEKEVRDFFHALDSLNSPASVCFAGNGFYSHMAPAAVGSLISRSEFLTAYTPYQPEISQGTLQYIFEYQSMMASLTGMEVSNASMYDGTTATAEAMMLCVAAARKRSRVLISSTVNEATRAVAATYARYHGIELEVIPETEGVTDRQALTRMLCEGNPVAGVIVATPNRYGILEDYTGLADEVHAAKALLAVNCIAGDLAVIKTPGEWGADIACGDAQSLGMPLSFGGPYLGFLCASKSLIRKVPGRIVGATTDASGQRVFVLTLQAREQHIRREKATSNICSNQGLMALYATIYLSLMGSEGLREVCEAGYRGAHYLLRQLEATGKAKAAFPDKPFLNEVAIDTMAPVDAIMEKAMARGILPGVKLGSNRLLIAVTEMQSQADIDSLIDIITNS
ncbi:MAG: aminomethyl-transferring glycine dehydrogenase subunit GcvPA [Pseudoflavonifractor sp.]|nr:aminomethyl-transferring glycine dehydrogenase subunit GcvPA [Alloprevotella sp.]MCM1116316.1 aminomethyl-transferring glycine dehydrogenase subunit GcvPA [Pseudoflavonifractor sp.]